MNYTWIDIKKQLPPVGDEVIVFTKRGEVTALARFIRYEGAVDYYWDNHYPGTGNCHIQESVTHWMPMPQPPTNYEPQA